MGDLEGYIATTRPTRVNLTPTVARLLNPAACQSITTLTLAGEMVRAADAGPWLDAGVAVLNAYGPAENAHLSAMGRIRPVGRPAGNVGTGVNTRLWVVAPDMSSLVPVGATGELVVEGPQVALGYIADEERTRASFLAERDLPFIPGVSGEQGPRRFYRTGDLARQFADGTLEVLGRMDGQVKISGQRVELSEIEAHIAGARAVVLFPTAGWLSRRLIAVIEPEDKANGHHLDVDHSSLQFSSPEPAVVVRLRSALEAQVPTYMVPSVWLETPRLPTSTSNKLDRKALLVAIEGLSQEAYAQLVAGRGQETGSRRDSPEVADASHHELDASQALLRDVCSRVLNLSLDQINMTRSFAGLGGDSITAMQVASKIRATADKRLAVSRLLTCPSLLEVARHVQDLPAQTSVRKESASKAGVRGGPPRWSSLSPIQRFFVDTARSSPSLHKYNQSIVVTISDHRAVSSLQDALAGVVERHAAFRTRFRVNPNGEWMQRAVPMSEAGFHLEHHPDVSSTSEQTRLMKQARESLNLFDGPVIRAQLFGDGRQGSDPVLFVVAHHIIVDLVSWRIVLEELETALESKATKKTSSRSLETTPFLEWVELQADMATTIHPSDVVPKHPPVPPSNFSYWGLDAAQNIYRDVSEAHATFDAATTQQLLQGCHAALRTEPVDALLASIFLSFQRAFPDRSEALPPIFNEGHGREPWDEQLADISRTIGWFTTISPVSVGHIGASTTAVDVVRRVKDWRAGTPAKGFSYFTSRYLTPQGGEALAAHLPPEILFNYEGRYQLLENKDAILRPTDDWAAGEKLVDMGADLPRLCLFEITAAVLPDGQMHLTSAWNRRARGQEAIERWLRELLPSSVKETAAALSEIQPRFTLSDAGEYEDLSDYAGVDALTEAVRRIDGCPGVEGVEAVLGGTPMQDALALSQSKPTGVGVGDAYEIDLTWEVTLPAGSKAGPLDPQRLAAAWRNTITGHPSLRTVFLEASTAGGNGRDASMLHQVVLKDHEPCLVVLDVAKDRVVARAALDEYPPYREEGLFSDLRPPHRLLVCSTADGRMFIRLQVNHIVLDGMSIPLLLRDLGRRYQHVGAVPIPPKPSALPEFIKYIRDPVRRASSLAYWKSHLAGVEPCYFPALIDPPSTTATTPPAAALTKRSSQPVTLSTSLDEIQQVLTRLQVTLPTLIHFSWALVLRLYTYSPHIVFGTLHSGRDAPVEEIDTTVAPFLAILPCLVDFSDPSTTAQDMLRLLQSSTAESMEHQASSLADIQSALRIPSGGHLFNSGVSILPKLSTAAQADAGWPLLFDVAAERDPTEFDLSLFVEVDADARELDVRLDYLESALGRAYAVGVAAAMDHMLRLLVEDPSRPARELADAPGGYDMDLLWGWNTPLIEPVEMLAQDLFAQRVLAHPDKQAVFSWDGTLTYAELDDLSGRLARHLVGLGVGIGPEVMVPLCFEKSMWAVVAILAVLKAGGCFVLLDSSVPEVRLWGMVEQVGARLVLCTPAQNRNKGLAAKAQQASSSPPSTSSSSGNGITVVEITAEFVRGLATAAPASLQHGEPICPSVTPSNNAYCVFTSGTTGTPKGTLIPHRALATGLAEHASACGMTPATRALQFASYSFDASIGDIFTTIQVGGTLCIPSEQERSPADFTTFIRASAATWAGLTPSFASLLDPPAVPSLEALVLAGEPLPASQIEAWGGRVRLVNMYGPTECTIACVANQHVTLDTRAACIGRGYRAATWVVREDSHEHLCPIGTVGELLIEGPVVGTGYLNRPEQTASVFIDSPSWLQGRRPQSRLYKTGDLVRYCADGTIDFVGRKDTQIKINGQRVEAGEIESTLTRDLDGAEAVSVTVEHLDRKDVGEDSKILCAFVCVGSRARSGTQGGETDIIATDETSLARFRELVARILHPDSATSTALPRYMVPHAFVPIEYVPLSTSGKTDRRALRNAAASLSRDELLAFSSGLGATGEDGAVGLETEAEAMLAGLWRKVLKLKEEVPLGKSSNFYRMGGDSIAAMGLRAEARRAGIVLSVADVFANPILGDMARVVEAAGLASGIEAVGDDGNPSGTPTVEPFALLSHLGIEANDDFKQEAAVECSISLGEIEDMFPCTPIQEALMALSQSSKSRDGAYALHAAFQLPADLDLDRLIDAWTSVIQASPVLRSSILARSEGSIVVVRNQPLPTYKASSVNLAQHLAEQQSTTFRYGSALFRIGICSCQDDSRRYLIINAHHAVYDGWSLNLIWDKVASLYNASSQDNPLAQPSVDSPPFQLLVQALNTIDPRPAEEYWRSLSADAQEVDANIPYKFPPVPTSHHPLTRKSKSFNLSHNIPAAGRATAATPADLINAAWAVTLSQYAASPSASPSIFGVTLSGRDMHVPGAGADLAGLVGPTITTVPRVLRVDPRAHNTVADFLRYVQATASAALEHQWLGLQRIAALGAESKAVCEFGSLLVVTPASAAADHVLGELGVEAVPIDTPDAHPVPLALECFPGEEGLGLVVSYDPMCLDQFLVEAVVQQFDHVLRCMVVDPEHQTMSSLARSLSPMHVDTLLGWNAKPHSVDGGTDLVDGLSSSQQPYVHEVVAEVARKHPTDLAVFTRVRSLSYSQLEGLADRLSAKILAALAAAGPSSLSRAEKGGFVGLYMDKSADAIVALLAILKAGLAFLPLSPSQPLARTEALLQAAGAKMVLISPHHRDSEALHDICKTHTIGLISVDVDELTSASTVPSQNYTPPTVDASQPAYMLYTSGTTGQPKGVVITHHAWASAVAAQRKYFALGRSTRMLQFSAYTFDVSLFEMFVTLASGGAVCVPSEQERMDDLAGFIRDAGVTAVSLTPTVGRLLAAPTAGRSSEDHLAAVELVVYAGEALSSSDVAAWKREGRRIFNAYGPTEACVYASAREFVDEDDGKSAANIGQPLGTELWVARCLEAAGTPSLCPVGAVGELWIGGPQLALGYHGDDGKTKLSFRSDLLDYLPDGRDRRTLAYRTGDLVRFLADGSLEYLGRADQQVKLRGQRLELGEIEHHIQSFMAGKHEFRHASTQLHKRQGQDDPALLAVLVMDVHGLGGGSQQIQDISSRYLGAAEDSPASSIADELSRHLKSVLPSYMVPSSFFAVERLPTTTSGKIDRRFITECFDTLLPGPSDQASSGGPVEPLTPEQALVRTWWAKALGRSVDVASIKADSDFFALGGNSLSAIRVASASRAAGRRIAFDKVFHSPVLRDMAVLLPPAQQEQSPRLGVGAPVRKQPEPFDLLSTSEKTAVVEKILPLYNVGLHDVEDVYPTTPLQESMMADSLRTRGVYVLVAQMDVPASSLGALQESWRQAFQDLELLRTRIIPSLGHRDSAYQVLMKAQPLEWAVVDDVQAFMDRVYDSHSYGQPLARVGLVKKNNTDPCGDVDGLVTVVVSIAHALFDGSVLMLWERLFSPPSAGSHNITGPRTSFKEYIRYHVSRDTTSSLSFWRENLAGLSSTPFPAWPPSLPTHHHATNKATQTRSFRLPSPASLQRMGYNTTAANVAQAAWALTVANSTGNADTLFRLQSSGRDADVEGIDTLAGPTIATAPFRIVVDGDESVSAFLGRVHRDTRAQAAHAYVGKQRIARLSEDCRRACALVSTFNFQADAWVDDNGDEDEAGGPWKPEWVNRRGYTANSLIVDCAAIRGEDRVKVDFNYDPLILPPAEMSRVMDVFFEVLEKLLAAEPGSLLKDVVPVPAPSHDQSRAARVLGVQLKADSGIHGEKHTNKLPSFEQVFRRQVEATPFQPALEASDGTVLTYMALDDVSSSLAELLAREVRGRGAAPVIGLLFEPSSQWMLVAMLAVLKMRGVFVSLDPEGAALAEQISSTGASLVLSSTQYYSSCVTGSSTCNVVLVDRASIPAPTASFLKPPYCHQDDVGILGHAGIKPTMSPPAAILRAQPQHDILYATNSTLCKASLILGDRLGLGTNSRCLCWPALRTTSPITTSRGLLHMLAPLVHGSTICIPPPPAPAQQQEPHDLTTTLTALHCTVLITTTGAEAPPPRAAPSLQVVYFADTTRVARAYNLPLSAEEELLADAWRRVLPVANSTTITRSDNFFELGGNHVLAMRLGAELRSVGTPGLEIRDVFEWPVLEDMAAFLKARQNTGVVSVT